MYPRYYLKHVCEPPPRSVLHGQEFICQFQRSTEDEVTYATEQSSLFLPKFFDFLLSLRLDHVHPKFGQSAYSGCNCIHEFFDRFCLSIALNSWQGLEFRLTLKCVWTRRFVQCSGAGLVDLLRGPDRYVMLVTMPSCPLLKGSLGNFTFPWCHSPINFGDVTLWVGVFQLPLGFGVKPCGSAGIMS